MRRPSRRHGRGPCDLPAAVPAAAAAAVVVALLLPTTALAAAGRAHGGGLVVPSAFLGIDIPSISDILRSIAHDLFNVLAGAFLPSWLRHAPTKMLRWLIALPDPADAVQWPTMHRLEQDTTAVGVAFLPLTLAVAAARYTASGVTGGAHHPAESLGRFVGAAFGLMIFPWAFGNVVAAVNVTTGALLGFSDIAQGLQRALALMFTGGLLFGVTGPLIALIVIGAILLAAGLFVMKVGILALFAILFVAGPLTLAGFPIPELHGAFRLWSGLLIAVAMIPIGWCVVFATAGAISADITHIGTPAAIGTRLVGFFAGVLTFFIAFRWPFFLISMVRSRGLLSTGLGAGVGAGGRAPGGAVGASIGQRAAQGRLALLGAGGAIGSAVSAVGNAVGAPRGGLVGGGARLAGRGGMRAVGSSPAIRYRAAAGAGWQNLRERTATSRVGRSWAGQRAVAAGSVLKKSPTAAGAAVDGRSDIDGGRGAGDSGLTATDATSRRDANHSERSRSARAQGPAVASGSDRDAAGTPPAAAVTGGLSSSAARASVGAAAASAAAAAQAAGQKGTPRPRPTPRRASPTPPIPSPPGRVRRSEPAGEPRGETSRPEPPSEVPRSGGKDLG